MNSYEYKDDSSACAVNTHSRPCLVMNGGCNVDNGDCKYEYTTTETCDGETFEYPQSQMLDGLSGHCAVDIHGKLFVTGGTIPQNSTTIGEIPDRSLYGGGSGYGWQVFDALPTPRVNHMCAVVESTNGNQNVIAAGGYRYGMDYDSIDVVEIFSFNTELWRTGQSLVFGIVCNKPLIMCLFRKSFTSSVSTCHCCAIW